tara:strand:+ start:314 stop:1612 length:1299 start_codon:yes stop_codon:yes gene_type:complete
MIEILNIVLTIIVFFILSFFSYFALNAFKINKNNTDIIDISGKNFLILLNAILILSLFNPNKEITFFAFLFLSLVSIYIFFFKNRNITNKIFYIILFLFVLIISIDISNNFGYTWDTKKYYLHKATGFYQNFFIDDFVKKTEYPHFGTYIWSFFWKNNLLDYEYTGRLIYGYIYALSIFYFVNSFNVLSHIKIFISILLILLTYKTILFDGRPDVLIFSLFLFLSKHFYEIFHKREINFVNIFFIVLILNLILWTKSEGIAYVLLTTFTLLLFIKKNTKKKLILASLILLIILTKYATYHYYGLSLNPNVETFSSKILSFINFEFVITRSIQILSWYFIYLFTNPIIIFSILSLILISIKYKKLLTQFNYLYFFLIAKFCVIFVTFFITIYPMPFHLKYSLDRIIFHSSGLFLVVIYYCIINFLKDKKKFTY